MDGAGAPPDLGLLPVGCRLPCSPAGADAACDSVTAKRPRAGVATRTLHGGCGPYGSDRRADRRRAARSDPITLGGNQNWISCGPWIQDSGCYEGTTFKAGLFAGWLAAEQIDWPRTPSGQLSLAQDTFRDLAKRYPKLEPLKDLRHSLSDLRLESLAVGPDGSNRAMLSPVRCQLAPGTHRATPSLCSGRQCGFAD